jgi:hypothetical protein
MYTRGGVNTLFLGRDGHHALAGSCLQSFGEGNFQKRQFRNEGRGPLSNRTRQSLLIPLLPMARGGWRRDLYVNSMQLKGSLDVPTFPCPLPVSICIPVRTSTAGELNYHILYD